MSHHKVIIIAIITWSLLATVPFLAYTKPVTNTDNSTTKSPEPFNTITYINTWVTGSDLVDNIFESKKFAGEYPIGDATLSSPQKVYDIANDASIEKYVSRKIPLRNKKYIPKDLVTLDSEYLTTSQKSFQLRADAAETLTAMAKEFTEIFNKKLVIVSAYRSYSYQQSLKKRWCSDTLCAPAGQSEHQLGLAIDLFAATTADKFLSKADFKKYYDWLAVNAHRYGRHNTYQKWVAIDTYQVEPRHRRYLGSDLATELYDQKMTFGEWVKKINNNLFQ